MNVAWARRTQYSENIPRQDGTTANKNTATKRTGTFIIVLSGAEVGQTLTTKREKRLLVRRAGSLLRMACMAGAGLFFYSGFLSASFQEEPSIDLACFLFVWGGESTSVLNRMRFKSLNSCTRSLAKNVCAWAVKKTPSRFPQIHWRRGTTHAKYCRDERKNETLG